MVGFNDAVQVFAGPMFCVGRQLSLPLQSADRFGIGAELVGGDRGRRPVAHGRQRFPKETMGCIAATRSMESIKGHACQRPETDTSTGHQLHIRLVHAPGVGSIVLVRVLDKFSFASHLWQREYFCVGGV